jgi:uncharacterized protein with PIN domain
MPMMNKFLLDHNLGKEARYLCYLGFDTEWLKKPQKLSYIKEISVQQERVFIHTRKAKFSFLNYKLKNSSLEKRLAELFITYSITKEDINIFQRCFPCNRKTVSVKRQDYVSRIPPFSYEYGDDFRICPTCGKLYWRGSHAKNLENFVDVLFKKYLSRCFKCKKLIESQATKYKLSMELQSTYDLLIVDQEVNTDFLNEEIQDLLEKIEKTEKKDLEEDIYLKKEYILCNKCRNLFLQCWKDFFEGEKNGEKI